MLVWILLESNEGASGFIGFTLKKKIPNKCLHNLEISCQVKKKYQINVFIIKVFGSLSSGSVFLLSLFGSGVPGYPGIWYPSKNYNIQQISGTRFRSLKLIKIELKYKQ